MTTSTGERVAIWGSLGVALIAFMAAGGLYASRMHLAAPAAPPAAPTVIVNVPPIPAPIVNVQAPAAPKTAERPPVETGEPAELPPEWKCYPKGDWNDPRCPGSKGDLLTASKGRHVTGINVKMKRHDAISMGPKRKAKKKSAAKKLKSDWKRADTFFANPFNMGK